MTTKTNKRWSKEEEQVLLNCVKENPNNLQKAFKLAAIELKRSISSCSNRWYQTLNKTEVCFVTIGTKTKNKNKKIVTDNTSDNTETVKATIWEKIKKLLKLC